MAVLLSNLQATYFRQKLCLIEFKLIKEFAAERNGVNSGTPCKCMRVICVYMRARARARVCVCVCVYI